MNSPPHEGLSAEFCKIICFSFLFVLIYFFASGASWGFFFFSQSGSQIPHWEVKSILSGTFSLSTNIAEMEFDLAWYNGGLQQVWGLGVSLWLLPFEVLAHCIGYEYCPDIIPLLSLLFLLSFYTLKTAVQLIQDGISPFKGMFFAFAVLFCSSLFNFLLGKKLIYEVTCLYSLLFSLFLLVSVVRYVLFRKNFDFFLSCFLAGFIANVRPTHGVYGVAAGCICIWFASESWRQSYKARNLWKPFSGAFIVLSGLVFLALSNLIRFGNPFEFGHNLIFSGENIIYLTRFGNPCEHAGFIDLCRELFFWIFIPYDIPIAQAPIPRWRDIYQNTFDLSYLLIFAGIIVILIKRVKFWFSFTSRSQSNDEGIIRQSELVNSLLFYFFVSAIPLFVFYLHFATLSTRYILDFAPAFLGGVLIIWSSLLYKQRNFFQILLYIWIIFELVWGTYLCPLCQKDAERTEWQKSPIFQRYFLPKDHNYFSPFHGGYDKDNYPVKTGITGNGLGWSKDTGEANSILLIMVDKPRYLELLIGPEEADREPVYRAKINNIELPLESVLPAPTGTNTLNGTNTAFLVRFSIPESILRQDNDQLVSLCFTPSYHEKDLECTRTLYQARWRDPEPEDAK